MNYSTAVFLINNKVRAVEASYEDGQKHKIFKTFDMSIQVGDLVVVPTDTRHKRTVVKVTRLDANVDFDGQEHVHWIVSKIDETNYKDTTAQESQAIESIKSAEIRKKREDLANALWADKAEELKAIPLASMNGNAPAPQPTE